MTSEDKLTASHRNKQGQNLSNSQELQLLQMILILGLMVSQGRVYFAGFCFEMKKPKSGNQAFPDSHLETGTKNKKQKMTCFLF